MVATKLLSCSASRAGVASWLGELSLLVGILLVKILFVEMLFTGIVLERLFMNIPLVDVTATYYQS